jgi:hypothetical protein
MGDPLAVHVHVHRVATGSFPLRVADILFTDHELVIPEYAHLTPLFGIARGRVAAAGDRASERYREAGLDGLATLAERTYRVEYDRVERVRLYDGRGTRPKIAVDVDEGPPYAYRIHAPVEVEKLASALGALGDRRGFTIERPSGSGFSVQNSLWRFLSDR